MVKDPQRLHDHLCDLYEQVTDYCFNQMSANEGVRKQGEKEMIALITEFMLLHGKRIFKAIRASDLNTAQKRNSLHDLNLIKEKRNGVLNAQTVADGRKQRKWYTKEDLTSPTISNNSLLALFFSGRETSNYKLGCGRSISPGGPG